MHLIKAFNIKKFHLLGFILLLFAVVSKSQDPHLSLYQSSPLFLNAGNTGNFTGDWRIASNYRNQWWAIDDAIQTATLSFDRQFYVLNQNIGGGIYFLHDNTGSNGLVYNKIYLSGAYNRMINNHFVSGGLQVGYVNASASDEITLPSDYDPSQGVYIPSNQLDNEKLQYLDINFGVIWKKNIKIFTPEAGISLGHINMPKQSFLATEERLPIRTTVHGALFTKLNDYYVEPLMYYSFHSTANNILMGVNGGKKIRGNLGGVSALHGGIYIRNGIVSNIDAIALHTGATIGRIEFRINYDINVSKLSAATGSRGAFEISFIYRSISTILNSYSIPCNRI